MIVGIRVYKADGSYRFLDLLPNTKLQVEQLLPAFDDKLESGIFTFPLDVPWTDGNRNWLGFAEHLNGHSSTIPEYWRCDIVADGVTYMHECKLTMVSHSGDLFYRQGSYKFSISGIKGLFGNLIQNKKLTDLELEGKITWDLAWDSRTFAFNVMDYQVPEVAAKLMFAPVVIETFIDNTRADFNTEFLENNTVNPVIEDISYPDGWVFGVVKPGSTSTALQPGDIGYNNMRTVPFLNFFWVLKQVFYEHGFTAYGEFFDYPDFDKIHMYNNVGIERYNYPFTYDLNRCIVPSDHVPDMLISDFLVAVQNGFNLKIDWMDNKRVRFSFKKALLTSKKVQDFTPKCLINYAEARRHAAFYDGVSLDWKLDNSSDNYWSDKVKELDTLNIIDRVTVLADINTITLPATIDETTYILITSENYLYNYDTSNGAWIPAIEYHAGYKTGKGDVRYDPAMGPLCQFYAPDPLSSNIYRTNKVAIAQHGSYINDWGVKVENPFGLRLFYILQTESPSYVGLPISFCHNTDSNNNKLVDTSLSWMADDGMYNKFWKTWIDMLLQSWWVKANFALTVSDMEDLNENTDVILANNNQFLPRSLSFNLPLSGITEAELLKL